MEIASAYTHGDGAYAGDNTTYMLNYTQANSILNGADYEI